MALGWPCWLLRGTGFLRQVTDELSLRQGVRPRKVNTWTRHACQDTGGLQLTHLGEVAHAR